MKALKNIYENIRYPITEKDKIFLKSAYLFAKEAHSGQKRYSGEDYINHVVRTAENLALFGVDIETLVAGILHDTIEDCGITKNEVKEKFGENICALILGVSKLGTIKYQGRERYADNIRHLFIATANDVRVILIKLADRLDNIRSLQFVPKRKQKRIALETLEIYAPIATRLGMGILHQELQDKAFLFAYPNEYKRADMLIKERGKEREKYIRKVYKSLIKEMSEKEINGVRMSYRIKGIYSIYKKLLKKEVDVAKVYDIFALRVIVETIDDCYKVLGIVHNMWKPLPIRFKDYIANPKINGYQSLHTTVFTGDGGIAEIQVRTQKMHGESEYGIAAHLIYKDNGVIRKRKKVTDRLDWLTRIRELQNDNNEKNPIEFLNNLKIDFFDKHIFVFTPKGDVIELPEVASALDFAYAIHSEVGNHTSGATVNGKFVSLNTKLSNQDIVEIQTKKNSHPTRKWFNYVFTDSSKKYIRNYLRDNKNN